MKRLYGCLVLGFSVLLIPLSSVDAQTLGDALDAPELVWTTEGGGDYGGWIPQTNTTHDGIDAAVGRDSWPGYGSWIETTVTGPVVVSYWWKIYLGDFVVSIDGVNQRLPSLGYVDDWNDWDHGACLVPAGAHNLRWTAYAFMVEGMYVDAVGYLDQVVLSPVVPEIEVLGTNSTVISNGTTTTSVTNGTDYGSIFLSGSSVTQRFRLRNSGFADLTVSNVTVSGVHSGDFQILEYPSLVRARTSSNFVIRFDPSALGGRTAGVTVANNGFDESTYVFAVSGTGLPDAPEILVMGTYGAAILDGDMTVSVADGTFFGGAPILSGAEDHVFTITNSGPADLVLSNVTFQGSGAAEFSALAYPSLVSSGGSSNLLIRFSPNVAGVITAVVAIANNDTDENPYEFAVMGLGTSTHHVWTNSPSPSPPYLSWETAAHTIQDAAAICVDGDGILATNGVYDSGSVVIDSVTNRVGITNAIRLCSVNGPEFTRIVGDSTMRCVYLPNEAILSGFTITNGHASHGGGVYRGVVSNCVVSGNQAKWYGGGVFRSYIMDSLISGNMASNGGGGAADATLVRCRLTQNQSGSYQDEKCCRPNPSYCEQYGAVVGGGGGGAYDSMLLSCLLMENLATAGGGASHSSLMNCTLISNQAAGIYYSSGSWTVYGGGGGIFAGWAVNCIFDGNVDLTQPTKSDWDVDIQCGWTNASSITYSCLANPLVGDGNVTGRATFVAGTYQLQVGSLGIDTGTNAASTLGTTDLAGNPRIVNGTVDTGAYEFQGQINLDTDGDGIPNDWESRTGLNPAVSNAPTIDSDHDGRPDIEEYWADTHPTNNASYFPFVELTNPPLGTMVLVVDPTSTARVYGVRWTANLLSIPQAWVLILPEKTGSGAAVAFTVTNDGPGRIYRTGVRLP